MPAAPVGPLTETKAVWVGDRLVIWGGTPDPSSEASAAGAVYRPDPGEWEMLPPSPIDGRIMHSLVWTGTEAVVWGGTDRRFEGEVFADGAAWNPATGGWRTVPAAPMGGRVGHEAVWDGTEMIVWGGDPVCCGIHGPTDVPQAAAWNPATGEWRRLPDVPKPWGHKGGASTFVVDGRVHLWWFGHLGVYDRDANRWRAIADIPTGPAPPCDSSGGPHTFAVPAAGEVFTWNGSSCEPLSGTAFHLTGRRTRTIARLDPDAAYMLVPGDGGLFAGMGESGCVFAYDIAADRWAPLPEPPLTKRLWPYAAWTEHGLLLWGGYGSGEPPMDGAIYDPTEDDGPLPPIDRCAGALWTGLPPSPVSTTTTSVPPDDHRLAATYTPAGYRADSEALADFAMDPPPDSLQPRRRADEIMADFRRSDFGRLLDEDGVTVDVHFGVFTGRESGGLERDATSKRVDGEPAWLIVVRNFSATGTMSGGVTTRGWGTRVVSDLDGRALGPEMSQYGGGSPPPGL